MTQATQRARIAAAFGDRLYRARKRRKKTMEQLGALAKMHKGQISMYEAGKLMPRIDVVRRLADALDVRTSDLIGD